MRDDHVYSYPTPAEMAALQRRVRALRARAMAVSVRRLGRWLIKAFASGRVAGKAAKEPALVRPQSC